ncbi:MAG: hypothetical protein RLY20_720 [Verrucomicrobiota bacterium]|jgi:hypothetical protein
MFPPVNTKDATAVEMEVQAAFTELFASEDSQFVSLAFAWTVSAFTGAHPSYQAIDAPYHDLEHTLQGTLCMMRILRNRHKSGAHPPVPQRLVQLGLLAILLHDTGYLKTRGDDSGTGAKYTVTHVHRSAEFAGMLMTEKGFTASDILAVRNMIHCTGVDAALASIGFQSEAERIVGLALGTGDLLGQMAAEDYVEKLPTLYKEFAEAAQFTKDRASMVNMFGNAGDLLKKTPAFWDYTKQRLTRDFGGLYRFLNEPYPFGPNHYLEHIEANIARVRQLLDKH